MVLVLVFAMWGLLVAAINDLRLPPERRMVLAPRGRRRRKPLTLLARTPPAARRSRERLSPEALRERLGS